MAFRFETVLRLRQIQEDMVQRDMAVINNHIVRQEDRLHTLEDAEVAAKKHYDREAWQAPDFYSLRTYNDFFTGVKEQEALQKKVIAEALVRREAQRKVLAEAVRRRRTIEILKERYIAEEQKSMLKRETELLDEVALNQWRRGPL